jgi:hypothetical protein
LPASHPRVKGVTVFCDRIAWRVRSSLDVPDARFMRSRSPAAAAHNPDWRCSVLACTPPLFSPVAADSARSGTARRRSQ